MLPNALDRQAVLVAADGAETTRTVQQFLTGITKHVAHHLAFVYEKRRALGLAAPQTLDERPLITPNRRPKLMDVFEVLANDSRLRLLHALARARELCVSDLAEAVGMKPQAVSNQLQRLSDRRILGSRRNGNHIFYSLMPLSIDQYGLKKRHLHKHKTAVRGFFRWVGAKAFSSINRPTASRKSNSPLRMSV
jgi:DNA-binding transcriptional ArsR family regulator